MPARAPVAEPVELVHVDAHCIVALKPAGLLAVPGLGLHGQACLAVRVQALYDDALVVHRLDMATSGLMLFARGLASQRRLGDAFARREVHKDYVAVVHGRIAEPAGEIALPLAADWPNRPRQKVDLERGKPSLTRYRVLAFDRSSDTTRVELAPVTGRTHQLRVHLLAIGHPIVGDALYATQAPIAPPAKLATAPQAARLLLHASVIAFAHPASGEPMAFESAAPF